MTNPNFSLFDTAIGRCGIAWTTRGLVGVQLPEARVTETRARILQRFPGAHEKPAPADVQLTIAAIVGLLSGKRNDLSGVALDMDAVPPFHRRVYEIARTIPPGKTLSYGEIAQRLSSPGSARAVGQALGKNPFAIVVPCHRVLAKSGKPGGFSASGGVRTKLRMLAIEGAPSAAQQNLFQGDGAFRFDPGEAVEHLRASDEALADLIDAVGPFRMGLKQTPSLFAALAEAIVYQQLTAKAAGTIHGRVCALFPRARRGPTAAQILDASDEMLRSAGLSRNKVLALKDLAEKAENRAIPTLTEAYRMEDGAIVERLTAVRGIGKWTVEMLLMFRLGRADVLPADDYGIRKGFAFAFKKRKLPDKKAILARGERWKPYRTVASWYLWRAVDLAKSG